jgi:hypothetical protein
VLAQLERRADVEVAEVDRRGERLRIRLGPGATIAAICEDLERMGFSADEGPDPELHADSWYGTADVGELSREEGRVIAARVVPPFAGANGITREVSLALQARVAAALHECFTQRADTALAAGGLARTCGPIVRDAVAPLISAERAAELGRAIEADLSGAHR